MAMLLPIVFFNERGMQFQEKEDKQHFQYVGNKKGTSKTRIIYVIKDIFRLKDNLHTLLLTDANGNTTALIGGMIFHSLYNIGFKDINGNIKNITKKEKLYWKDKIILIVDKINQINKLTLVSINSRLKLYKDNIYRPFSEIPIVIFFGDFFQFDPVKQISLLLAKPKDSNSQRPENLAKHIAAYKLFFQFTVVVILREQVRTAGCIRLRGFLRCLYDSQQTELNFQRLYRRLYNQVSQPFFVNGLRTITSLNQDRWDLNIAAVV